MNAAICVGDRAFGGDALGVDGPLRGGVQRGLVAAWGITPASQVVVYDASGGGNAAARLWWMLRALGHRQVLVLDGGLAGAASGIAQILFFLFLAFLVISLVVSLVRKA